jgi:hypothetical protein
MRAKVISREGLSTNEVKETIVDKALLLDEQIKLLKKELDTLKEQIKAEAVIKQAHELHGLYSVAKLTDSTEWDVSIDELMDWLKKNKKMDLLHIILKPSVSEIQKYIGEMSLKEFAIKNTKTFSRLSLKRKKHFGYINELN